MPKFIVTVAYTVKFEKELNVYAKDEGDAEEKACEIVERWNGVESAEATDVEEG